MDYTVWGLFGVVLYEGEGGGGLGLHDMGEEERRPEDRGIIHETRLVEAGVVYTLHCIVILTGSLTRQSKKLSVNVENHFIHVENHLISSSKVIVFQ